MKFSFIIPVYKTEEFLPRCLDSLVAQTVGDFEAIVVDDCSPSSETKHGCSCSEIVARYDGRFRYIRHDVNRSAFQARRTAVMAARGDYIVPLDSDDYVLSELLARLGELIGVESPDIISYWMDYDNGKRIDPHWCRHAAVTCTGIEALQELSERRFFTGVASKVFSRRVLLLCLSDLAVSERLYINTSDDFLMLVPALLRSRKVSFLDYAGYRYFVNERSTTFSWKTNEGLRQACQQTRLATDLVIAAAEKNSDLTGLTLVRYLVSGIERWFVQVVAEGPGEDFEPRSEILLEHFHSENVAQELVRQLVRLRTSRIYRYCGLLSSMLGLKEIVRIVTCRRHCN